MENIEEKSEDSEESNKSLYENKKEDKTGEENKSLAKLEEELKTE